MDTKLFICVRGPWQNTPGALQMGLYLAQALEWDTLLLGLSDEQKNTDTLHTHLEDVRSHLPGNRERFSVRTMNGDPGKAILSCVGESTGLVVTGPVGRSSLFLRLWGPVAGDLLRDLRSSLLFVPGEAPPAIRHILLAIGALNYSSIAVEWGLLLARSINASVTLLHVVHPHTNDPSTMQAPTNLADFLESETIFARNFQSALARLQEQNVDVTPRIRVGHPLQEILAEIDSTKYDLLILGSHYSASHFAQLVGGISQSAVRETSIPILVTRSR